jgi:hypothetical protein
LQLPVDFTPFLSKDESNLYQEGFKSSQAAVSEIAELNEVQTII